MSDKATLVAAVLLGCGAGFLGGRLAAPEAEPQARGDLAALEGRLADLEATADALATQVQGAEPLLSGTAAPAPGTRPTDLRAAVVATLKEPTAELDGLLAAAVERSQSARKAGAVKGKEADGGEKTLQWIEGELARWAEKYDLAPHQLESLKSVARAGMAEITEAKQRAAPATEIAQLEVKHQGQVREIVGDRVYAETERERVMREARGNVTWLAAAVGLTPTQHTEMDRILTEGVTRALPMVVRLRSEALTQEESAQLHARLNEQRGEVWDSIRNGLLTEEQRARIPGK